MMRKRMMADGVRAQRSGWGGGGGGGPGAKPTRPGIILTLPHGPLIRNVIP